MKCTHETFRRHNNPMTWILIVLLAWLVWPLVIPDGDDRPAQMTREVGR